MDAPADHLLGEFQRIAASYCGYTAIGDNPDDPSEQIVDFALAWEGEYFVGPCPWQIAAEVGELVHVREVDLVPYVPGGGGTFCGWGCEPVP